MRGARGVAPFAIAAALLVSPAFVRRAGAQQESAAAAMPEPPGQPSTSSQIVVQGRAATSPAWTQTRTFAATRFWLLDPGRQAIETWWTSRRRKDGNAGETEHLFQLEYMVGATRGFELDVYFNYQHDAAQGYHVEGAQLEARVAPWRYGEVFLNPTLYLEWHPRNRDANRGEARLLLGGEVVPRLRGVLNPFVEQNLDSPGGGAPFAPDRELGMTGALSYAVIERHLMVGGETRLVADQQGGDRYQRVAKVGPAMWASFDEGHVFVTTSLLFGLTSHSDAFNPIVVLGIMP